MAEYAVGLTLEEGIEKILNACCATAVEVIDVDEACGRILAEDIISSENIPPFARSPYDGYAFRSEDVVDASKEHPVTLKIIEEVPAGHVATKAVKAGEAIKILTGAPIPDGVDVVEKYESTIFNENTVQIVKPLTAGTNIVPAGEDVAIGTKVMAAGEKLTPAYIGLLAGLGHAKVSVHKKVIVSLISTGDELVEANEPLQKGKIRNSSLYMIQSYLNEWGMKTRRRGIVRDDVAAIAQAVEEETATADVVITTGGVSVGDYDCLQRSMEYIEAEILFWKLQMKPGSAFLASKKNDTLILSLSGNPSAAMIALMLAGKPALAKMSGQRAYENESCMVVLKNTFPKKSPNRRFIPGKLVVEAGIAYLETAGKQGNGMLSPMHGCNLMGEIPAGSDSMEAGTKIKAYYI